MSFYYVFPYNEAKQKGLPIVIDNVTLKFIQKVMRKDSSLSEHISQIRDILLKPLIARSSSENYELGNLIKDIPFFRDKQELSRADIQELASVFKF